MFAKITYFLLNIEGGGEVPPAPTRADPHLTNKLSLTFTNFQRLVKVGESW